MIGTVSWMSRIAGIVGPGAEVSVPLDLGRMFREASAAEAAARSARGLSPKGDRRHGVETFRVLQAGSPSVVLPPSAVLVDGQEVYQRGGGRAPRWLVYAYRTPGGVLLEGAPTDPVDAPLWFGSDGPVVTVVLSLPVACEPMFWLTTYPKEPDGPGVLGGGS